MRPLLMTCGLPTGFFLQAPLFVSSIPRARARHGLRPRLSASTRAKQGGGGGRAEGGDRGGAGRGS